VDTLRVTDLDQAPWLQLQPHLESASHDHPGWFEKMLAASHRRQHFWMATDG